MNANEPGAAAPSTVVLDAAHAREMLAKRYPSPEWALMLEVAPATGGGTRYADAIAVNLWGSRGHAIHGFEVKVSRSDWQRELKDPAKAEPLYRNCDHWWIVAPRGVVRDGELPPTWGLLELRESGLTQTVAAPRLEAQPLTRAFFASLMRRGHEQIEAIAERMQRQAVAAARAEIDERVRREVASATRHHAEMKAKMDEFQRRTGVEFSPWSGPPVGIVKLAARLSSLQGYKQDGSLACLADLATSLEDAAAIVRKAVEQAGLQPPVTTPTTS